MNERQQAEIEADLTHVRWLLQELPRWDNSLAPVSMRAVIREFYSNQETLLSQALAQVVSGATGAAPKAEPVVDAAPVLEPISAEVTTEPVASVRPDEVAPVEIPAAAVAQPEPHVPRVPRVLVRKPAPPALPPKPPQPSAWDRLWKPIIGESLGWFIGAFLILAGTFAYLAGEWNSMSDLSRALTVFGMMVFWSLGFAGWGRLLSRKETTRPASTILWRISAAVAPLATVALGPILSASVVLALPLMVAQAAVAALLARKVALDTWQTHDDGPRRQTEAGLLAIAIGFATVVLGAAPALSSAHASWLELLPIGLALVAWRNGPADTGRLARFSLATMGYVLALIAIRLHVATVAAGFVAPWGIHAVALSAFAAAALELRQPSRKAADGLRIVTVALQGLVLVPAAFSPSPSFVLAALIATFTTARLALHTSTNEKTARWVVPAYAFGYAAFQSISQLVPPIVMQWFQALKSWLGYATAPMPPSYVSVYAAFYVIALGVVAGVSLTRAQSVGGKARASVLLTCTTWGSLFFGAVAMLSLPTDTRPAMVAVPLLFLTTLALSVWHDRDDLARAAAALAVGTGVSFAAIWHEAWPVAALALAVSAWSIVSPRKPREAFSAAAMLLVALAIGLSFMGSAHVSQAVALVLASAAAMLVARNLDDRALLAIACTTPLLLVIRFGEPALLSLAGLAVVAVLPRAGQKDSRLGLLWLTSACAAFGGVVWQVFAHENDWPTVTLAIGAAALVMGARRMRAVDASSKSLNALTVLAEASGLLFVVAALVPASRELPFYLPWHAQLIALGIALGTSIVAVRSERSWQGVLLAAGMVVVALGCAPSVEPWRVGAGVFSAVVLVATPALLASLTVPVAALAWVVVLGDTPEYLVPLAVVLSLLALLEETDFTWTKLLNRSVVGWAGSLCAAAVLALAIALKADLLAITSAALVLPLAWVRATRRSSLLALGVALSTAAGVYASHLSLQAGQLLAPISAVIFARLLLGLEPVAHWLGVKAKADRALLVSSVLCAWAGVAVGLPAAVTALWVVSLLLLGGEAFAMNVIGAALAAAATPELQLPVAGGLVALAVALHHVPEATRKVLGAQRLDFSVPAAALGAVVVALSACVYTGGTGPQSMLGVSLLVAGVLLGQWPLASLAVALAGVDLHGSLRSEALLLTPWALYVAAGAALVAIAARFEVVSSLLRSWWKQLGTEPRGTAATPWWWGAMALTMGSLLQADAQWLVVAALLVLTVDPLEAAVALAVGAAGIVLVVRHEDAAMALGAAGALFAWLGAWQRVTVKAKVTWFHAGWVLALISVVLVGGELRHDAVPLVWALSAVTAWAVAKKTPALEWGAWAATWFASHVLVAHVGLRLATGAPVELVVPWLGLATAIIALVALLVSDETVSQRRGAALTLGLVSMLELFVGLSVLNTPHQREAVVALVAGGLVLAGSIRRAIRFDDGWSAWLGQTVVVVTVLALRRLGAGVSPGIFEAWAAMTWGPVLFGLALFLGREHRPAVAASLRGGALLWPLVGLIAAPWNTPSQLVLLLLVQAGHYAWLARSGLRRSGAGLSAIAFNGAMIAAFFATGWHGVQDLALPAGLSILALTNAFRDELGRDVQVKLRAVAMTAIYAAAAWRPLTFTTSWGLIFCVVVCVCGVAAGAFLRIRSFVLLGTAFLVTSVVATLIRQGLAEPRLGAVLLAAVGLGIVGFMVIFTTRRAELQARMSALQAMFSNWER